MPSTASRRRFNDQSRGGLLPSQTVGGSDKNNDESSTGCCIRWCASSGGTSSSKTSSKERKQGWLSLSSRLPEYLRLATHPNIWNRDTCSKSGHLSSAFWLLCLFSSLVTVLVFEAFSTSDASSSWSSSAAGTVITHRIVFSRSLRTADTEAGTVSPPTGPMLVDPNKRDVPEYGSIEYKPVSATIEGASVRERVISPEEGVVYALHRKTFFELWDDMEDTYSTSKSDDPNCREVPWVHYKFPACNSVHEIVIERAPSETNNHYVTYIRHGTYRDAWRLFRPDIPHDDFVMKRYMSSDHYTHGPKDQAKAQIEAIILERMSHSRNILDIYAHCGTSVFVESMAADVHDKIVPGEGFILQSDLDRLDDVQPQNNLTNSEKLQISLSMAESLRDLHEFEGGVIVHSDTHIEQWLIGYDGSVKLNDFNNAYVLQWNAQSKEYCTVQSSYGGTYRSPEEYSYGDSDESKDTYAYSNCIYGLLTGLWQFYDEEERDIPGKVIRNSIVAGVRPFVDERYKTRSFIEGELVKVMALCWQHQRGDRPPMSKVADILRRVKSEAIKRGEMVPSQLIHISMDESG